MMPESQSSKPSNQASLQNSLKDANLELCSTSLIREWDPINGYPIFAVWEDSDIPTQDELILLSKMVEARKNLDFYQSMLRNENKVNGPWTIILRKKEQNWKFRRINSEWYQEEGPLDLVSEAIFGPNALDWNT